MTRDSLLRCFMITVLVGSLASWRVEARFGAPIRTEEPEEQEEAAVVLGDEGTMEATSTEELEEVMRRRRGGFRGFRKSTADILAEEGLTLEELEREKAAQAQMRVTQVHIPEDLLLLYDWSLVFRYVATDIWVKRDLVLVLTRGNSMYAIDRLDGYILWKVVLENEPMYEPTVTKEAVYVVVDNFLVAIDKVQGRVIWRRQPDFPVSAAPMVIEPVVYIPSWQGKMYALEIKRRERVYVEGKTEETTYKAFEYDLSYRWHLTTKGMIVSPAIEKNGMLYFGSEDGFLYSISRDGDLRFKFQTQGKIGASPASISRTVFVGSTDFNLYAVDRLTGDEKWHFPSGGDILEPPVVDPQSQMVYVPVKGKGYYALNTVTGREVWHMQDGDKIAGLSKDRVYMFLKRRKLVALEKETGEVMWSSNLAGFALGIQSANDWTDPEDPMRVYLVNSANVLVSLKEQERLYRKKEGE